MKCTFYLLGFVFSALVALLIFVNSKKGLEKYEADIIKLETKIELLESKLEASKNE